MGGSLFTFVYSLPAYEFSMRYTLLALVLLGAIDFHASRVTAQDAPLAVRVAARRDLEQAKTELRYYWQVEYPRKCRELDTAIEMTRLELENNNALLRDYRPYTRFSTGQPFPITVRSLEMCVRATEMRLNDLLAERNALIRFHSDQYRMLEAQVYEARLRVAELEAEPK